MLGKYIRDYHDLTLDCLPIVIEAFKNGTRFSISEDIWERGETICEIEVYSFYDTGDDIYHIRVSNDERRRILAFIKANYKIKLK